MKYILSIEMLTWHQITTSWKYQGRDESLGSCTEGGCIPFDLVKICRDHTAVVEYVCVCFGNSSEVLSG